MSGVSSLLKYRYKKRSNSDNSSSSSSNGNAQDTGFQDSSEPLATSPIFPSKFGKTALTSTISAGPTSTDKSASSSPWLSKESSLNKLSAAKSKKRAARLVDSDESSNDSSPVSSLDPRDLQAKVSSLSEMFPGVENSRLEEVLNMANGKFEAALDLMIEQKVADERATQRKRKYAMFQPSSVMPDVKRSRKLSSSDESADAPKSESFSWQQSSTSASASTSSIGVANEEVERPDACVIYERIKFLQEAFPNISRQELKRVLTISKYDIEMATATLTSYQTGGSTSQTKNLGSIKAFIASRVAQTKNSSNIVSLDGTSDTAPSKKMDRQRIMVVDSHSDSEEDNKLQKCNVKTTDERVLDFFNSATVDELTIINGCSLKKAVLVVGMRPFTDWSDLVGKIENCQALPSYLLSEGREIIRLRNIVTDLMKNCQQISSELQTFIADLVNRTSIDASDTEHNYVTKQPDCLSPGLTLKPYQMVGLNWLLMMNSHDLSGILGDEMGLGKTIQTIAFLAQLYSEGVKGPHVIIAPSSTLDNWLRELQLWCPSLRVLLYYGSQESRRAIRNDLLDGVMDEFHILITTYNMASGSTEDRILFKKMQFHCAIFDEGHMLKNMDSIRYKSLMKIVAKRRLLLTGTPLQNNLIELMSLLIFLMPHMFVGKTDILKRIFTTFTNRNLPSDIRGTYEQETLAQTKQILKPFFLRRLKTEVLEQLPAKVTSVVYAPMSFEQQDLYDELRDGFVRDLDINKSNENAESEAAGAKSTQQPQSGSAMMMQLRKAANHHLLHRRQFDDSRLRDMAQLMLEEPSHREANAEFVFEDMQVMSDFELHNLCNQYQVLKPFRLDQELITDSGKFRHLDELLPTIKAKGERVLLFSQFTMMLDIIEVYMTSRQHKYLRLDGSTPVVERQELVDTFNTDDSVFIFLLSTKAGGLGINLTAANVVVLHDIDFNPYNDKQAEDRCHRLGQNREVMIYKLISKNTIEEAMWRCADAKLKLERDITGVDNKESDEMESSDVASLLKEALQMRSS